MAVPYAIANQIALGHVEAVDVTIPNGESLSDACSLVGYDLVGLLSAATWTAAAITFAATHAATGGTFAPVKNADGEVAVPSANVATGARENHALNPADFLFAQQVKVRSGTAAAAVNQGAARTLTLLLRRL